MRGDGNYFSARGENILPRYFLCSATADQLPHYASHIYLTGRKLPSPRPLVGAFLHLFRLRWNPIAPSRAKENHSTIDRPDVNIYCRTGSYLCVRYAGQFMPSCFSDYRAGRRCARCGPRLSCPVLAGAGASGCRGALCCHNRMSRCRARGLSR